MRNPTVVLKTLETKARDKDYRYQRLYRNLYNPDFYMLAYKNIARSQGSMTAGMDGMTLDGMSMNRINRIIASLRDHSYKPKPTRREYIPKKGNPAKKRPLGIPSSDDRLIQEVVRMILEAIYEPTFSNQSHGFRPNRSCHTALSDIKDLFTGATWIIEGDIQVCFDSFDHHTLISILRRRIHDEYFISLAWKFLKAGYMEQWRYNETYSGCPQGSGISPILANIYLNEMDDFVEQLRRDFDTGTPEKPPTDEYTKIAGRHKYIRSKYRKAVQAGDKLQAKQLLKMVKKLQNERLATKYAAPMDKTYRRIQYNRYADDLVLGIIGSKEDAERIKAKLSNFLQDKLKLTLSQEKTHITHASELVRYLGYDFCVAHDDSIKYVKGGTPKRVWNGKVRLYLPREKWQRKLQEYGALKIIQDKDGSERWKSLEVHTSICGIMRS